MARTDSLRRAPWVALALGCITLQAHCGASADDASAEPGAGGAAGGADAGIGGNGAGAGAGGAAGSGGTGGSTPPPERELETSYLAPAVVGRWVMAANRESGRVALIDSTTLAVRVVDVGLAPTRVATAESGVDGTSASALVLNTGSDSATLLRVTTSSVNATELDLHPRSTSFSVAPRGQTAIAWSDARELSNLDATEGLQDVTVLELTEGKELATRLSVGYRPASAWWSSDGERAYFVTEPGVSVIDLSTPGAPRVEALYELTDDPLDGPAARDVTITPNGDYAVLRSEGASTLGLVSLRDGARREITLPSTVTDLDLAPDGSAAYAVLRGSSSLAVAAIPDAFDDPSTVVVHDLAGTDFGSISLSATGDVGLLYTNGTPSSRLGVLGLGATFTSRSVDVKSPVLAVFASPDGSHAVSLQAPITGGVKRGVFSLVPTRERAAPKIVGVDAPATTVAFSPVRAGVSSALVTVREDATKQFGVHLVGLPSLRVDYFALASAPIASGVVPAAGKGWVFQEHPNGRITFVDLAARAPRTLTGFELGAEVRD